LARPAAINQVLEQNLAQAHSHLPAAAETDEAIAIAGSNPISGNIFSSVLPTIAI